MTMDGHTIARIDGFTIADSYAAPGTVQLHATHGSGWKGVYQLSVARHLLMPARAQFHGANGSIKAPPPVGATPASGSWSWFHNQRSGSGLLGEWSDTQSECRQLVATMGDSVGSQTPVTGPKPARQGPASIGLGWSPGGAVVSVSEYSCSGSSHRFPIGVYVFSAPGVDRRIPMPSGSYAFRMWGG
jgi:hypothetical protein